MMKMGKTGQIDQKSNFDGPKTSLKRACLIPDRLISACPTNAGLIGPWVGPTIRQHVLPIDVSPVHAA